MALPETLAEAIAVIEAIPMKNWKFDEPFLCKYGNGPMVGCALAHLGCTRHDFCIHYGLVDSMNVLDRIFGFTNVQAHYGKPYDKVTPKDVADQLRKFL